MKNKKIIFSLLSLLLVSSVTSCFSSSGLYLKTPGYQLKDYSSNYIADDQYKNYYQILVYSYFDSNGDGVGDIKGLISKLDYLNSGDSSDPNTLGIDGIYLLPIFKSSSYHKYNVSDYYTISSDYGTIEDFELLVSECNKRGISIILDLPVNHTSRANHLYTESYLSLDKVNLESDINDNGTIKAEKISEIPSLGYYNWKLTKKVMSGPNKYRKLNDTWSYEAYFDTDMPDLNLSSPEIQNEVKNIMKFWLDKGIKGFRLDGVEHYFDESPEKTYDFCNKIMDWGHEIAGESFYAVGEGPWSSAISKYYGNSKLNSFLNFYYGNYPNGALTGQINKIIQTEQIYDRLFKMDTDKYLDESGSLYSDENLENLRCRSVAKQFQKTIEFWDKEMYSANPNAIDANFLTNHDTVREIDNVKGFRFDDDTEEFSDVCLQRLKMIWAINHLLSGNSFTYYGEEIGMRTGKQYASGSSDEYKNDPNKRHPMHWSDEDTSGTVNIYKINGASKITQYLEAADKQILDANSLWNFFKEIYKVKSYFPEIARGKQKILYAKDTVICMEKDYNNEKCYLVYNLSRNEVNISLEDLQLKGKKIKHVLSTDGTYSKISGKNIGLPDYSVTILK